MHVTRTGPFSLFNYWLLAGLVVGWRHCRVPSRPDLHNLFVRA